LYLKRNTTKVRAIGTLIFLGLALGIGWAQTTTPSPQDNGSGQDLGTNGTQQTQSAPAPAFGVDTTLPASDENPPISGLDQPSLEPEAITRSFLSVGAILSESADSNIAGTVGAGQNSQGVGGATRAMGDLTLHRIKGRFQTDLQYLGGVAFYEGVDHNSNQLQEFGFAQRVAWRTGQLVLRDAFSYLPDGTFGGGSYGGSGALQSGLAGMGVGAGGGGLTQGLAGSAGGIFGAGQLASLGQEPRITNSAVVDLVQSVSPRSSFTLAGSYGLVHFTNGSFGLVNSNQAVGQAAYDRIINRRDQIALAYAVQELSFPQNAGSSSLTQRVHFIYAHKVSGRMDFVIGAGPQVTQVQNPISGSNTYVSASGNLRLRYRFARTSMQLEYRHFNNNGSGYFLGASSDLATLSATRSLTRVWEGRTDMGFARSIGIGQNSNVTPATSNFHFFAGAAVHRHIGRYYRAFLSYQFSRVSFNNAICVTATDCGKTSNRQVGAIGFEWYPRPIRLD
jgi:hypothetical protein